MTTANPLLDFSDLPRFDTVQPEHVKPAIESLLTAGRELIERLTADTTPATWKDFAGALSDGLEPFGVNYGIDLSAPVVERSLRTEVDEKRAVQRPHQIHNADHTAIER